MLVEVVFEVKFQLENDGVEELRTNWFSYLAEAIHGILSVLDLSFLQ